LPLFDVTEDGALHKLICKEAEEPGVASQFGARWGVPDLDAGFLSEENFIKSSMLTAQALPYYFSRAKECLGTIQRDDIQSNSGKRGILTFIFLLQASAGAYCGAA
jgi:hypothetical protein